MQRSRLLSPTWFARHHLAVLLGLFLVGLSIQYTMKAMSRPHRSAILRWQPQLLDMQDGDNIAHLHNYPNPPIMGLLLIPLAHLPPLAAGLVWFYLKVGMTILAVWWVFRLIETPERPFPFGAKVLTAVLSLRPIMGDLQHGNINLFILFLVVAFLTLWRCGRDLLAGVVLALAIACKLTPAAFLPYLVWKRSWRALAGSAAGLMLFFWPGVVPGLILGWEQNNKHLASWYEVMVHPFVAEGEVTSELNNQSLPGLARRLATHSPSSSTYVNHVYTPLTYDNFLNLEVSQVRWFVKGCTLLFGLVILWSCRTPTQPRYGWRLAAEFSMIMLAMLLFSERTWKHHCVVLLLPFAVLSYYLFACSPSPGLKRYLIATLAAAAILMASTSNGLLPKAWAKQAQLYGAYVYAYLVLAAGLVVLLRSPPSCENQSP